MEEHRNVIHLIALADNEETASTLLNSALPGVSTSDNQEWTVTEGDFTVKCYIKVPGADTSRRSAEHFVDIIIGTASDNSSNSAQEIVNYLSSRGDVPLVHFVSDNGSDIAESSGVLVVTASDVKNLIKEHSAKVKNFNETLYEKHCNDIKEIPSENYSAFFEACGLSDKLENIIKKMNSSIPYTFARKLNFTSNKESTGFKHVAGFQHKVNSFIDIAEKYINEFISNTTNTSSSVDLSGDIKVVPSNTSSDNNSNLNITNSGNSNEAEGIGLSVKLLVGEDYKKKNSVLPLVIRDNVATLSIELPSKSSTGVDAVYATLNGALQMASQMGVLEKITEYGATLTLRKETSSVFVDLTVGKILGDFIVNKLNRLNLDIFKTGISEYFSVRTGVSADNIYKDFDVESLLNNLAKTTIIGSGRILNVRTLLHLFKTFQVNHKPSEEQLESYSYKNKRQAMNYAYFGLKTLFCFEKTNIDIIYSAEDLKDAVKSGVEPALGEEYENFKEGINQKARETIEGLLGMLESFKGMAMMFGEGASLINLDKISVDILAPGFQLDLNLSVFLNGVSAFLEEKIFS